MTLEGGVARRRHFANPETGEYRGKQMLFKATPATATTSVKKEAKKENKADEPKVLEAPAGVTPEVQTEQEEKKAEAKS